MDVGFFLIVAQFCRNSEPLIGTHNLRRWHVSSFCATAPLQPSPVRVFCQLAQACSWGRGGPYLERSLLHVPAGLTVTHFKRIVSWVVDNVCCVNEKSQSHGCPAYAERLKWHNSFLNFGPTETAACVPPPGLQRFHLYFFFS